MFSSLVLPLYPQACDDKENIRQVKKGKRRFMDDVYDPQETPRPHKRQRESVLQLPYSGTAHFFPSPSSPKSDATPSEASVESHQSGRLSPSKQLQALEDDEQPVYFCNFWDTEEHEEHDDVATMRDTIQGFADGVGVIGYSDSDLDAVAVLLPLTSDRTRFKYSWVNDCARLAYGVMPSITRLEDIVKAGWNNDRGTGTSEDDWNTNVQHPLLKLALETCKHRLTLDIYGVYGVLFLS